MSYKRVPVPAILSLIDFPRSCTTERRSPSLRVYVCVCVCVCVHASVYFCFMQHTREDPWIREIERTARRRKSGVFSLGKGRYLREAANVDVLYMYMHTRGIYRYIIGEFASRDFAICLCKDMAGELRLIDTLVIYEGDLQQFATRVYV